MTMTVELTLYTYSELSDDAKEQARQCEAYDEWKYRDARHILDYGIEERGMKDSIEVHHDLSFCQGAGVGFSGEIRASEIEDPEFTPVLLMLAKRRDRVTIAGRECTLSSPAVDAVISIERAHHHNSPACFSVDVDLVVDDPDNEFEYELLSETSGDLDTSDDEAIAKAIKGYFDDLANKLYREASDYLLEDLDDETNECFFEEHRFLEDGTFHDYVFNLE